MVEKFNDKGTKKGNFSKQMKLCKRANIRGIFMKKAANYIFATALLLGFAFTSQVKMMRPSQEIEYLSSAEDNYWDWKTEQRKKGFFPKDLLALCCWPNCGEDDYRR
ncbi:hypothetical protein PHSC3_001153 [Chlamydiales bacterium STE3]|nr:hypothetical protein PHSC3_001153 [Chlamydiales bacterium STE3]